MHPAEDIVCESSNKLKGKTVVMGITGSIAATECFATARELIRHGADVIVAMTGSACKLVTPQSMEFATGNRVVTELTGAAEHIDLMEAGGKADLLLVCPATANTISKIANGIDDTPVTSMATVALGSGTPIIVAPSMHLSMWENPAVRRNVGMLEGLGVTFVGPRIADGRAKIASRGSIVGTVIRRLSKDDLMGMKILVIGGRSEESIDSMRIITNRSSGLMAISIVERAFERGADVELWMGSCDFPLPDTVPTKRFRSVADLEKLIPCIDHDFVIVPAALSDFAPADTWKGKVPSDKAFTMKLDYVPKMLPLIRRRCSKVIGFKAESGLKKEELINRARARLVEYDLLAIVANDVDSAGRHTSSAIFVTPDADSDIKGYKSDIAETILDYCLEKR